jgi:elongation factor Ts
MLPQFVRIRANRVIFSPLRAAACRNFSSAPAVPVSLVKALRERTGAPMVECKNALAAEGNDVERAVDWLRKKGVAVAGKKAGRAAAQGLVAVAVSDEGDAGAIVEVRDACCLSLSQTLFRERAADITLSPFH